MSALTFIAAIMMCATHPEQDIFLLTLSAKIGEFDKVGVIAAGG